MDQIDIAVYGMVHRSPESTKEIASKLGMSYQMLVNKVSPCNETHKLTLREAIAIMLMTDDIRILQAIAAELDCFVGRNQNRAVNDVMAPAMYRSKKKSDYQASDIKAVTNDSISIRDQDELLKEIQGEREVLDALEQVVIEYGK